MLKRKQDRANESQVATKKQRGTSTESSGSNYQGHLKTLSEVQVIVDELEKKHKDCYTPEQIRAWGHMIHMKKHSSYDEPPQKPFFMGSKRKQKENNAPSATLSPGKCILYRSECINQLDKWHDLLEKGVISSAQFTELQETIMNDIKRF